MVDTRKGTSAAGMSPKNLHGENKAESPPSGARSRSKSPIKQQDTTQQPAMASATATANSGVFGDRSASPPPLDSGATNNSQGQQNETDSLLLTQETPSINSQSSISEQKSYSSTNSETNILDISGMVGKATTSSSGTSVLAQSHVDMLTAEPADKGALADKELAVKELAEKKLAEQNLATNNAKVMQDGKLYPQSPSKRDQQVVTVNILSSTLATAFDTRDSRQEILRKEFEQSILDQLDSQTTNNAKAISDEFATVKSRFTELEESK